ncbi:MAG: DNA repair protein RadB, partial [Nanohaloarchaea archaeon SW_7_46_7]
EVISSLENFVEEENIELVIVDSAVSLYRLKVNGDNASEINNELSQQFSDLSNIARKHSIPVIVTNQVYTSFDEEGLELVGRDVPKYWSKCLIKLSNKDKNVRKLEISKHRSMPEGRNTRFKITNQGLESVDEDGLF